MDLNEDTITRAKTFALRAHQGQWLYGVEGVPVSNHLEEVARLVAEAGGTTDEIVAAWLHDTVEDTSTTLDQIRHDFGPDVAEIVEGLTDAPELDDETMPVRKQKQAERLESATNRVKLIKLADQAYHTKMAGTDHRSFDSAGCLEYIEGARLVAGKCRGVSKMLDAIFDTYYKDSKEVILKELASLSI